MAKLTIPLDNHQSRADEQVMLAHKLERFVDEARNAMRTQRGAKVVLNLTYDVLDAAGRPASSSQQFVPVAGRVMELRDKHVNYEIGSRRLHVKRIPLSLIEHGDSLQVGAENINVRKWFVDKEGLDKTFAGAL